MARLCWRFEPRNSRLRRKLSEWSVFYERHPSGIVESDDGTGLRYFSVNALVPGRAGGAHGRATFRIAAKDLVVLVSDDTLIPRNEFGLTFSERTFLASDSELIEALETPTRRE